MSSFFRREGRRGFFRTEWTPKSKRREKALLRFERCEDRTLLNAQMNIDAGNALDFIGSNVNNNLTVSIAGGVYTFNDSSEVIDVANAGTAVVAGSGTNTVTVSGIVSLLIQTGAGTDTVNIRSIDNPTEVRTQADADTVNVSSNAPTNTGNLDGINALLELNSGNGAGGGDVLNISESGSAASDTVLVDTGNAPFEISGTAGGGWTIQEPSGIFSGGIFLTLGNAGNTVNVQSTFGDEPVRVNTGTGVDTVNVSSNAPLNTGTLDDLDGLLLLNSGNGAGNGDVLNISESGSAVADTVLVNTGVAPFEISGTTGGGWTIQEPSGIFSGGINLFLGSGGNTVNVQSTFQDEPVDIRTGTGVDTVNVSSNAPLNTGTLDNLNGLLELRSGGGAGGGDVLNISESGNAVADTVLVDTGNAPFEISGTAGGGWTIQEPSGIFSGGIFLTLGSGGNTVNVQSTFADEPVRVNTGSGVDTVNVSSNAPLNTGTLDDLDGLLLLNSGNGAGNGDVLNISERGSAVADTVLVNTGLPPFEISGTSGGGWTIQEPSGIFSGGINLFLGSAADTVNVLSTFTDEPVSIDVGDAVFDAVFVGVLASQYNTGVGDLSNISGNVFIADPTFVNLDVFVDDSGSTTDNVYEFNNFPSRISGSNFSGTITYDDFDTNFVEFLGGPNFNQYNVNGTNVFVRTTITDGPNGSFWFVTGDNLFNENVFNGGAGDDFFFLFAGTGFTGNLIQVNAGGDANDQVIVVGTTGDDSVVASWFGPGAYEFTGLGTDVNATGATLAAIDGNGGNDDLLLEDASETVIVFEVAPQTPVDVSVAINNFGAPNFFGFNIDTFTVSGDEDGSGDADVLAVLATSTVGLQESFEAVSPDGSDVIFVDDTIVSIDNVVLGPLLDVNIDTFSFTELDVFAGNEFPFVGDTITAVASANLEIFIDGQDPVFPTLPGDTLNISAVGTIEIFRDLVTNGYVIRSDTGETVAFTDIETINVSPTNGVLKLLGDFDNMLPNDDFFEVDGTGVNSGFLRINDEAEAEGPISFSGVTNLIVIGYGGDDTLDITPYASYVPPGWWGIDVLYDEGSSTTDLLIYNGVPGVSETMTVVPSGIGAGEFRVLNAGLGNIPIVTITYLANDEIEVNANDGALGDTDTLVLQGAATSLPLLSGDNTFEIDFSPIPGEPNVRVLDDFAGLLYQLNTFTNLNSITFEGGAGDDTFIMFGSGFTSTQALLFGGIGNDVLVVDVDNRDLIHDQIVFFDGGAGFDAVTVVGDPNFAVSSTDYTPGPNPGQGRIVYNDSVDMTIDFVNIEPLLDLVPAATLTVNGNPADNAITYSVNALTQGVVSVDNLEPITFANKTTLVLNGRGGADLIAIDQSGGVPAGLTAITVNGGLPAQPSADVLSVAGSPGVNDVTYSPNDNGGGTIALVGLVPIAFAAVGRVAYNGRGGSDNITYQTPVGSDSVTYTPGAAPDDGVIDGRALGGGSGFVQFAFDHLGAFGSVTIADAGGVRDDIFELNGTENSDEFDVTDTTAQIFRADQPGGIFRTVLINTTSVQNLVLNGLAGDDVFTMFGTGTYSSVLVDGGDPTASDIVELVGDGTDVTVTYAVPTSTVTGGGLGTVDLLGVEILNLDAATGNVTIVAPPTATVEVTPTGADAATVDVVGVPPLTNLSAVGGLIVDTAETVVVHGNAADNVIIVDLFINTFVEVDALQSVSVVSANVDALVIESGLGSDQITVAGTGGPALYVNGGDPTSTSSGSDLLSIIAPAGVTTITPGVSPDSGEVFLSSGDTISFSGIENVDLQGTGFGDELIVNGGPVDTTFHLGFLGGGNTIVTNVLPRIQFTLYPTVQLAGGDGSDTFNVSPVGLVGVTEIRTTGSAFQSDLLRVHGTAFGNDVTYEPFAIDSGRVSITGSADTRYFSVHAVEYIGPGGADSLTMVIGALFASTGVLTPGPEFDSGSLFVEHFGTFAYSNLGFGSVGVVGASGDDELVINGSNQSEFFSVNSAGTIALVNSIEFLPINTAGVSSLVLSGFNGNDEFDIAANHPFDAILVDGGDPSASDSLDVDGTGGPITVDFNSSSVTEDGFGPIFYIAVEHIDVDAAGAVVTVLGIAENEVYEIVAIGPNSSRLISFGHPIVEVDNGTLVVDTDGGIDAIEFFGTEAADVIVVTATDVTINGAVIGYANAAAIIVSGLGGNDLITITSLSVPTTVRGGEGDDQILGGAAAAVAGLTPVLYGDDGNDIINGTQGSDMIFGGDGNDIAFGDGGFDIFFGGADSDRFIWLPGDGDDLIEGGTGEDVLQFDGNNNDEIFTMTAVGTRLLFQRDLGGIDIDAADFETVQLNTQGQVDRVFINDLTQTAVRVVNVNLQGGLGANNFVTVRGRQLADDIFISNSGIGSVLIAGLRYDINVQVAPFNFDFITVEGLGGDDTIKASAGLDFSSFAITLDGGEGDDFLSADATLIGGAGDDVLVGGAGNDSITGGAGNDTIFSGTGDDILQGDEGNDVFHLEGGTKTVEGGSPFDNGFDIITVVGTAGPDVVTVSGLVNPITIDLNANPNFVTVSEIDRIDITTFEEEDEIGYVSFIPGRINTGDGNDLVDAVGSEAAVSVFGGQGNDLLVGGTVNDTILGDSGNDTILGGPGDDFLEGGDGSDTFRTGIVDGEDVIEGGSGNDVAILQGSSASDNDFDVSNDNIRLAAIVLSGTTTAAIDAADVEQLDLIGGTGVDDVNILDLWLTDVILVNVDLSGGLGPDASMDCVCVNGRNVADDIAVVLNDATGDIQVEGLKAQVDIDNYSLLDTLAIKANAGNDTIAIIPPVLELIQVQVFGGFGNDLIEGASQADGDAGGDTLIGTDGPDTLIGGPGDDLIIGLAGNDLLIGDGDIIPPPLGDCCGPFIPTPVGGFGNDTIFGDAGDDSISGTGGNDVENGGDGNDLMGILVVGAFTFNDPGNDTIHGDAGNDSIQSDTGDDVVFGDSGIDFIDGGADNDNIDGGSENDRILGNTGNDTVQGGTGNDLIYGFTGNDVLAGGDGSDTICGEEGDDILSGEGGGDLLISGVGNDAAMGGDGSDTVFGGLGNDILTGDAGDDFLFGNDGNDFILGGDGNDVAFGTTGDDSILGGLGNDSLYGGDGFDQIHGGNGPIRAPHTRPPAGPNDGNDLILGGDGFDQVDGGNGNNIIDAGADGFRETILAGRGRDVGFQHAELGTGPNGLSDLCALDGGHNICVHVGELIEPFSPEEPPCDSSGLTVFNIGAVIPPVGSTFTDPIELPILFIPSVHGSTPIEFPPGTLVPPPHVLRRMEQALRRNSKKGKETPKSTAAKPRGVLSFWRANSKNSAKQGAANQRAGR